VFIASGGSRYISTAFYRHTPWKKRNWSVARRAKGYTISEHTLQDGSIKIQINTGN
jgi:hypothetical protein